MVTFAGPGAEAIFLPFISFSDVIVEPLRITNCSIWYVLFWLLSEMYIATPGFLMFAFMPSMVTSTAAASIWLVIIAATLGGPPMSRIISGSMFTSLK